jgi:hypothetical protein
VALCCFLWAYVFIARRVWLIVNKTLHVSVIKVLTYKLDINSSYIIIDIKVVIVNAIKSKSPNYCAKFAP